MPMLSMCDQTTIRESPSRIGDDPIYLREDGVLNKINGFSRLW